MSLTDGHPARWNDKTLVRFDIVAMGLRNGQLLNDFTFKLYDYDEHGIVKEVNYRGPWIILDIGYLRWSTTIPPFKLTTSRKEIRFSEWMESIRKDVECTFGILKGIEDWHSHPRFDMVWKTCCALHNWLLEVDGLGDKWENGVPSEWEGPLGQHDLSDIQHIRALARLNNPGMYRNYDGSGIGQGDDRITQSKDLN